MITEDPTQDGQNDRLAQHHQSDQQQDYFPVGQKKPDIQKHADGRKKHQTEYVAQRNDVAQRLITVIRLAQQHPGHKSAERKRKTENIGCVPDTQPDGGGGDKEKLPRIPVGNVSHQPGDDFSSD